MTLPADHHDFEQGFNKKKPSFNGKTKQASKLKDEIWKSMRGNTSDFYFHDKEFTQLFDVDGKNRQAAKNNEIFNDLWMSAVEDMGFKEGSNLLPYQRQALYLHFVKFTLTDHIKETLNPESLNISCKDAIDRGGVGALYLELVTRVKKEGGAPFDIQVWDARLHGAALTVKGREMNDHRTFLWNALVQLRQGPLGAQLCNVCSSNKGSWIDDWLLLNNPINVKRIQKDIEGHVSTPEKYNSREDSKVLHEQFNVLDPDKKCFNVFLQKVGLLGVGDARLRSVDEMRGWRRRSSSGGLELVKTTTQDASASDEEVPGVKRATPTRPKMGL